MSLKTSTISQKEGLKSHLKKPWRPLKKTSVLGQSLVNNHIGTYTRKPMHFGALDPVNSDRFTWPQKAMESKTETKTSSCSIVFSSQMLLHASYPVGFLLRKKKKKKNPNARAHTHKLHTQQKPSTTKRLPQRCIQSRPNQYLIAIIITNLQLPPPQKPRRCCRIIQKWRKKAESKGNWCCLLLFWVSSRT